MIRYFLSFLFAISTVLAFAKTVVIEFEVKNPTGDLISLSYKLDQEQHPLIYKAKLKKGGILNMGLSLEKARFIELEYHGQRIEFYAGDSDWLKISFDGNDLINSLEYKGVEAGVNQFLLDHQQQFNQNLNTYVEFPFLTANSDAQQMLKAKQVEEGAYYEALNEIYLSQRAHIQVSKSTLVVGQSFWDKVEAKAAYFKASHQLLYPIINASNYNENTLKALNVKWGILGTSLPLNDKLVGELYYNNYLKLLVQYLYLPKSINDKTLEYQLYDLIQNHFKTKSKFFMQKELMRQVYMQKTESSLAKDKYADFHNHNPYPAYNEEIIQLYGQQFQLETVETAPNFTVVDENGRQVSLSDYTGKVVYISFWASWCGPCLKGFRNSESLRKQIQKEGVVLLNVSLDKKASVWKGTLNKQKIVGINTKAIVKAELQQLYDVGALPAYFIVDKKGKFTYLSDNPDRNIIEEFRGMVKK